MEHRLPWVLRIVATALRSDAARGLCGLEQGAARELLVQVANEGGRMRRALGAQHADLIAQRGLDDGSLDARVWHVCSPDGAVPAAQVAFHKVDDGGGALLTIGQKPCLLVRVPPVAQAGAKVEPGLALDDNRAVRIGGA